MVGRLGGQVMGKSSVNTLRTQVGDYFIGGFFLVISDENDAFCSRSKHHCSNNIGYLEDDHTKVALY